LSDGGGRDRYPKHYTDNSNFHDRFLLRKCEVFTDSISAIARFRRKGMEIRRQLHVTVLQKQT